MRVRISIPDVVKKIAAYVTDPEHAEREHAFELTMRPFPGGYTVDGIAEHVRGETSTVHTPKTAASAHTHNIKNYKIQQCHVGWPSGEDMHWIFSLAVSRAKEGLVEPVVHLCSAVEATYAIVCAVPNLAALEDRAVESNARDILAHFASAHGHRCDRGAKREGRPCGSRFVKMAHAYRFTGKACERHAGEDAVCTRASAHRKKAAELHKGPIFRVAYIPHELYPNGVRAPGYCGADAERHLSDINFGHFDAKGTIRVTHAASHVDINVGPLFL